MADVGPEALEDKRVPDFSSLLGGLTKLGDPSNLWAVHEYSRETLLEEAKKLADSMPEGIWGKVAPHQIATLQLPIMVLPGRVRESKEPLGQKQVKSTAENLSCYTFWWAPDPMKQGYLVCRKTNPAYKDVGADISWCALDNN